MYCLLEKCESAQLNRKIIYVKVKYKKAFWCETISEARISYVMLKVFKTINTSYSSFNV